MDKRLLSIIITLVLFLIVMQASSALPVYLSPKNSSGDLQISGSFDYAFNLTTGSDCTGVVYTQKETVVLDKYGFGFVNLNTTNMTGIPIKLCEYRNDTGVLTHRANHSIPDHVARNYFGSSMNLSGNISAANFNHGNATLNQGWFNWLGDIGNRITKLWVSEIDTANLTVSDNLSVAGTLYANGKVINDTWAYNQTLGLDYAGFYDKDNVTVASYINVNESNSSYVANLWDELDSSDDITSVGTLTSLNSSGNITTTKDLNSVNITVSDTGWFAWLGDIINPILKGWFNDVNTANLTVTDNTTVKNLYSTGNITANNVFLPQYIFSHTNATLPVGGVGVWTNVTFAQEEAKVKEGVEHTVSSIFNYTFNITQDGVYELDYDFDVEDTSVGASDIDVAGRVMFLNGTEVAGSVFEADITKQGIEVELSHDFLAKFLVGDQIVFQFTAGDADVQISTHGSFGDHPESASVVIKKVAN